MSNVHGMIRSAYTFDPEGVGDDIVQQVGSLVLVSGLESCFCC